MLHLNASAHYTKGYGFYEEYKQDRKYKEYGLIPDTLAGVALKKTDLVRRKWLDNDFYGITYALSYESKIINATFGGAVNRYDGDHFGNVIWVRNAQNLQPNHEYYRSNSLKDEFNIYAKGTAIHWEKLFSTIDLQYRHINYSLNGVSDKFNSNTNLMDDITNVYKFDFFNPKVGLTYQFNKENNVYASYSIANREPNRSNYTDNSTSAQPKPERLYDTEIGYRFQSPRFSASANFYYMNYKDQLILTGKLSDIGEALTSNIPESYRAGIEFVAGAKLSNWLRWDANATFSKNQIIDFTDIVPVYNADYDLIGHDSTLMTKTSIAFSPSFIANNIITASFENFEVALFSNFVGKQYLDNTSSNERSLNAYFVNNMSFKYSLPTKFVKGVELQLLLNNLFNAKYESNGWAVSEFYEGDTTRYDYIGYYPQAGFNFLASITLKF
jgi:iron complex outermembrane receptor protein